jgi:cytochrome c peroxidase
MKWIKIILLFGIAGLVILPNSCRKKPPEITDDKKDKPPTAYVMNYPYYFPPPYLSAENPMTVEGVSLGRMLYYEPLLSQGGPQNGMSCATCHVQSYGFTLPAKPFEEFGIVMPHINLAWSKNFLWNGKVTGSLEDIMKFEVQDFFQTDVKYLNESSEYKKLVKSAFGKEVITHKEVEYALAQFFRTQISGDSKFDKYLRKEALLTDAEMRGLDMFFSEKGDCFHCHGMPMFTDNDFHNIGLDSVFEGVSKGRFAVTNNANDMGKLKTPTLRNVALRKLFMHNGQFKKLEEVVQHYNKGVKNSPTLDPIMTKDGKEFGLGLTDSEVDDIVAFLHTLTDNTFITNPNLSKP